MDDKTRVILSICIPTTNRADILLEHLNYILSSKSTKFDVIIFDGRSEDGTIEKLNKLNDKRLKCHTNNSDVIGYENQWYGVLEKADGIFAMHLNDRDILNMDELDAFIMFLETHINYAGGVCKYLNNHEDHIECIKFRDILLKVPYFAVHPTGIVLNVDAYKKIPDREELFCYKNSGSHPHDILLGRLCTQGSMFIYTSQIWVMAPKVFYKKNKSGFQYDAKKMWFEPEERIFEMRCCINELNKMNIDIKLKNEKVKQITRTYLYLSTIGYFYILTDEAEASHYGIKCRKMSLIKKLSMAKMIVKMFTNEPNILDVFSGDKSYKWIRRKIIIIQLILLAAPFRDCKLYHKLKNLYNKARYGEGAALR